MNIEKKLDIIYSENSFATKYRIDTNDKALLANSSHSLYGEIERKTVDNIVDHFKDHFQKDCIFYDIGSGLGKMVFHIGLKYDIESYGIELSKNKHQGATYLKDKVCSENSNINFINKDFFKHDLSKANVVYFDNTIMDDTFFNKVYDKLSNGCLVLFRRGVTNISDNVETLTGDKWKTQYGTSHLRYIIKNKTD